MIFEISGKFCQKATNTLPKKFYWQNWPQIWGSFAHLLSKKILKFFFVKFWQILAQISKKFGILIIGSRTLKITPSGGSPSGFHPPQDPHNGPPNTVLDILESHKCIIKRQIFWCTLLIIQATFVLGFLRLGPRVHEGSFSSSFLNFDFDEVGGSDSALCRFYPCITRSETISAL